MRPIRSFTFKYHEGKGKREFDLYLFDIISEEEPFIDQFFSSVTRKRDRIRSVFGIGMIVQSFG